MAYNELIFIKNKHKKEGLHMKEKHRTGILMVGSAVFAAFFMALASGLIDAETFALGSGATAKVAEDANH